MENIGKEERNGETLYCFASKERGEEIVTDLCRRRDGTLCLTCCRSHGGEVEQVCLKDLGRAEEDCLAFVRTVAESHTDPRVLLELWEEYIS